MEVGDFGKQITELLRKVNESAARSMTKFFAPLNITPMQGLILSMLCGRGDMLINEIGESMRSPVSNVSNICSRLLAGGYVEKRRDSLDQRKVYISATEKGRELNSKMKAERDKLMTEVEIHTDRKTREEIISGLTKLTELLSKTGYTGES